MTVNSVSNTDGGVYVVTITGKLNGLNNPSTGAPWTVSNSFTLTIVPDCMNTNLTDKTITNMAVLVTQSTT